LVARVVTRRFMGRLEQLGLAIPGSEELISASVRVGHLGANATDIELKIDKRDVFLFESQS
jgi:hypothetical protein